MLRSVALAFLLLHASSISAAPIIVNGSFELPAAPLTITSAPDAFGGWTVVSGNAATSATTATYNPSTGSQFVLLPAGNVQSTELEQPLTGFVPGVDYEIRYVICGYNAQATAKDCALEIVTFNHKQDTYDLTVPAMTTTIGTVANPWQPHSFTFTAEGTSTVLNIGVYRSNAMTDAFPAFDDFSIRVVPQGAPTVTLAGKKPRRSVTKKLYALNGLCAGKLPIESITVIAGKSAQTFSDVNGFATKIRLKKGRNRIFVTATDIAGTVSPAAVRVVNYKK